MVIEDIHLNDKGLRESYISKFKEDVSSAFEVLNNSKLTGKKNIAGIINQIADLAVTVQGLSDDTFKSNKIQVSKTPPVPQISSGEIYFKEI